MQSNSRIFKVGKRVLVTLAVLISTAFLVQAQDTPPNLTAWSDLDAAVASAYAGLTNEAVIYPPGPYQFSVDQGYFTFTDNGEAAVLTNFCTCSTQFNVPVWQMTVVETQATSRIWLYEGAGGVSFYTNQYPSSYDPIQWVRNTYSHDAPDYLTGADLDQWYAERDRSRFYLTMTFVDQNAWPTLQAAEWAATTNAPAPGKPPPFPPADTNQLAFAGFQMSGATPIGIWFYTPSNRPVAVLTRTNLLGSKSGWTVLGSFNAVPPFHLLQIANNGGTAFFTADYTDVHSDGDGIPDFLETYVYGTDPTKWDSDGDGISDYDEIFIYGTNPLNPDATPPTATITTPPNNYQLVWMP